MSQLTSPPPSSKVGSLERPHKRYLFTSTRQQRSCPNCPTGSIIIYDNHSGDELCSKCGLVLESRIMSEEQEWRSFSASDSNSGDQDRSRVGGVNDAWLESGGVQGTAMIGGDKKHSRLVQMHEMATAVGGNDRIMKTAFNNLRHITDYFNLREHVVERCKEIVKDLQLADQLRSRTGDVYMLSVVYLASREEQITKSLKELITYNRAISEKELGRAINRLKKLLPSRSQPVSATAIDLIPKICQTLQLSEDVANAATHVSRKTELLISKSHRPNVVAAGSVYLITQICQLGIDIYDIANTARLGAPLVLNLYCEMLPVSAQLLPPNFNLNSL